MTGKPLTRPCSDCPFLRGSLFENSMHIERAQEIADSLEGGAMFSCHKTVDYEHGRPEQEKWCAGALATMENEGTVMQNQMVRICVRLGMIGDPAALGGLDECYGSLADWVESHSATGCHRTARSRSR